MQGTWVPSLIGELSPHAAVTEPVCHNKDPWQPKFKKKKTKNFF